VGVADLGSGGPESFTHPAGKAGVCKRLAKLKDQTIERKPHLRVDCAFYPSRQVACLSTFFQIFSSTLITSTNKYITNTPVSCQDYPFEVRREIDLQSMNNND